MSHDGPCSVRKHRPAIDHTQIVTAEMTPERRLWIAVIVQAFNEIKISQTFFFPENAEQEDYFIWVCQAAGLDPIWVQGLARKIINKGG